MAGESDEHIEFLEKQEEDDFFVLNSDFVAQLPNQITCLQDDKVKLIKKVNEKWWLVQTSLGARGQVPATQLTHYFQTDEKQPGPSNSGFKRTASKIFQRKNSVRGLKVSTAAIKSSTIKLKDQFTPKRKTSKLEVNIPADQEKSRGWGFVKNKFLNDGKKRKPPDKPEPPSNQKEEKTNTPEVTDVKVVNSTPNKPPRRNKRNSAESRTTQGTQGSRVASPAGRGSNQLGPGFKISLTGEARAEAESDEVPRVTPRSGDLSLNESCAWDSYVELEDDEGVQLVCNQQQNIDNLQNNQQQTIDNLQNNQQQTIDNQITVNRSEVAMETERGVYMRESSTDTSCFESGSEVAIDTLPDPPAPGTFSPARTLTASSTTTPHPSSTTAPHASSTTPSSGLLSAYLSPTNAGSTLTVVNVTPSCSTEDLLSLPTTDSDFQNVLNSAELQEILSPTQQKISSPSRQKTAARSLRYEEEESEVDLSGAPDPPTSQITPTKRHKPARAPSNISSMSIMSDMSSAPSEAPSYSGTKSGIHYFSPPPEAEGTGGESDVLDTPRIKRIIKSDPVYTQIVDDSFFDNPLEVSELDDVISMRSEDLGEDDRDKMNGQSIERVVVKSNDDDQPISQGSDPKWDEYARKVREKKKREDEEKLRKEEEKAKKKQGRSWFMKNRKDPKDKSDNNFVKKKEVDELHDTTMSSTNTLTNTPTNTSSNNLTDTPTSNQTTSTSRPTPSRPPLPRKKHLQRQRTLNEDSRPKPSQETSQQEVSDSVPTSGSSDYVTASTSLSESGSYTRGYTSDTLKDCVSLSVVDEISESDQPKIEFRRSSFDLSKPSDIRGMEVRAPRRSASESEIFDLISPTPDNKDSGKQADPLSNKLTDNNLEDEMEEEVEEQLVIRRVRSDMGTPGSSDTHVTQDTPTNEDEEKMETEEAPAHHRPSSLSLTDDALDMSATNTLSFAYTQPPELFIDVRGEKSLIQVSLSPKLTPEKKQGTSQDYEDEVFDAGHHGDGKHHHGDEEDDEVVLQVEKDHLAETKKTPPSGSRKRRSRSESEECPDIPQHQSAAESLPAPQVTPLKIYSPPKAPRYSQNDISPTSRLPDTTEPTRSTDHEHQEQEEESPAIESHYEELNISNGTPVVSKVTVIDYVGTDEEEQESEPAMSGGKKNKVRKQYSYCDGKENLRVANSPQHPRYGKQRRKKGTSDSPGDVEVDSAMTNSEHYSYPRAPGDNMLSPGDIHPVKVLYKKAYSHPPMQDRNMLKLDLAEPPPTAPPQLQPSAPDPSLQTPMPRNSMYVYPEPVLYAEPNHPGNHPGNHPSNHPGMPPPLPDEYIRRRFGEGESGQPPARPPAPPAVPRPPVLGEYHQTEAGYHQTSGADQSHLYPTLSTELKKMEQDKPQKLSGTDTDEIVRIEPTTTTATAAAATSSQSCGVQTRNVRVNTDTYHYASYSTDPKSKSWQTKFKKMFGIEKSASKKKMKVPNVERDNVPPPRPTTAPALPTTAHSTSPSVVRTRAEVTAHVMTSQPHTVTSQPNPVTLQSHAVTSQNHASPQLQPSPCTPTAPQPTPEPNNTVSEYEPDNKPGKQPELYPPLPTSQPSPPPVNLTPSQINTQIFGTAPAVPFPNIVPNVPFMWFPYGVPQPQAPGCVASQLPQAPLPPSVPQLPLSESQTSNRMSKRKKMPESGEHDCIDPTLLSKDLIRHVKRSCGLNSSRSRTAARAIIQCLEDSVSDTLKIQLLSELLTAMDTSYRSRRSQEQEPGRRKRTRALLEEENSEVPRNHSCKKALREERILMKYLQQVLEILEEMSDHPDKENETFHMYFNLANRLLDTMYHKIANKPAPFDAS